MAESVAAAVKIRASVPSGLEFTAAEECTAIIGKQPTTTRGCIEFIIPSFDYLHKVDSLRSIENFNVVVTEIKDFCQNKSNVLDRLEALPGNIAGNDWLNALRAWKFYNSNVKKNNVIKATLASKNNQSSSKDTLLEEHVTIIRSDQSIVSSNTLTTPLSVSEPMILATTSPSCSLKEPTLDIKPMLEPGEDFEPSLEPVDDFKPALEPVEDFKPMLEPVEDFKPMLEPVEDFKPTREPEEDFNTSQEPVHDFKPTQEPVLNLKPILEPELLSVITTEFKECSFRVTAVRAGPKTLYSSTDASKYLGSGIIESFNWPVDLKTSDIEIILNLNNESIIVSVALTRVSKHRRNLMYLGPTSLRPTIAYGLLRMAHPKPGDVILDPMCGGGSISIEGFHGYPGTFHLCGDIHNLACKRAKDNMAAITNKMGMASSSLEGVPMDIIKWDICNLPLKTSSVDVIVTDMPFGKRMGSKAENWNLYKHSLEECGRVCIPETGRAIFLTHDTKAFAAAMKTFSSLWQRYRTYWINHGGLKTGVYVLLRTKLRL